MHPLQNLCFEGLATPRIPVADISPKDSTRVHLTFCLFKTDNYTYPKYLPQAFTNMGVSLKSILIGVSIINHPYVVVWPKILAYYVTYDRWFEQPGPPKKPFTARPRDVSKRLPRRRQVLGGLHELMAVLGVFFFVFLADGRKGGIGRLDDIQMHIYAESENRGLDGRDVDFFVLTESQIM